MSQPQTARQYQAGRHPADQRSADSQGFGSRGTNSPLQQAYNERPNRYPGPGGDGPRPSRSRKVVIGTVAVAAVAGAALGLGGAALFGGLFSSSDDKTSAAPTHTLEQIASSIGCKPLENARNSQYREAACTTTGGNRYTILTFDTDAHMASWQAEAAGYGGAYLVGTRWLVVANNRNTLDPFVSKLGGEVIVDKHG